MNVGITEEREIGLMWGMSNREDPWSFKVLLDRQKSTVEAVWSFQEEMWGFRTGSQGRISETWSGAAAVWALHSLEALLGTEKMKQEDAKLKAWYAIQE